MEGVSSSRSVIEQISNNLPETVKTTVPHVQQKHNWDCGLACSLMVLSHFKKSTEGFCDICTKLEFGESVWTIDLANLLMQYNIRTKLCTTTLGVDKGYSKQNFYKAKFTADERRVNKLFEEKQSLGLSAEERSVSTEEILRHLSQQQVAIVLLDWSVVCRKLFTDTVKCLPTSCVGKCGSVYQGHFVVVCGYNKSEKIIYFQNPAISSNDMCSISVKCFDAARKSYGTDEDILFIYSS